MSAPLVMVEAQLTFAFPAPAVVTATKHPVDLLRDGRGVYGLAGVDGDARPSLILRPDRLPGTEYGFHYAVLQTIFGSAGRRGIFRRSVEEAIRQAIHHGMLNRAGLPWPPPDSGRVRWWSSVPEQQARNRQIYHGMGLGSLAVVNALIAKALEEAADPLALKLARRFRFEHRYEIYDAAARSIRALQLIDTFPALGLMIYGGSSLLRGALPIEATREAARLVEIGAPLKHVAGLMGLPMPFHRVKPFAASAAVIVAKAFDDSRLVDAYLPASTPKQRAWLNSINEAERLGPEFVHWTARHAEAIGPQFVKDVGDWVKACYRASVAPHVLWAIEGGFDGHRPQGEQFVVRRFSPDMSLATVSKLSADWHEAVAEGMTGPNIEFPPPWLPAGESGGFEIVPIADGSELYREGKAMHHCVGTYADKVRWGDHYYYSIRREGERIETMELVATTGARPVMGQLRGPCNSQPPKDVVNAAKNWLRAQKDFRFPRPVGGPIHDDDIPF